MDIQLSLLGGEVEKKCMKVLFLILKLDHLNAQHSLKCPCFNTRSYAQTSQPCGLALATRGWENTSLIKYDSGRFPKNCRDVKSTKLLLLSLGNLQGHCWLRPWWLVERGGYQSMIPIPTQTQCLQRAQGEHRAELPAPEMLQLLQHIAPPSLAEWIHGACYSTLERKVGPFYLAAPRPG